MHAHTYTNTHKILCVVYKYFSCLQLHCVYFYRLVVLPSADPVSPRRYMAYITDDKIGLQILPLDGNPHNAMALTAHPLGVSGKIFTCHIKYYSILV